MELLNKRNFSISMLFVIALIFTCDYWLSARVVSIYESEFESDNGSFVITIENPPLTKKAMLAFWHKYKKEILKKTGAINNGKGVLFVRNKFEPYSSEEAVQFCLSRQIKEEKACVNYGDRLFVAEHKNFDQVDGYWLTFSDYYKSTSCAIYDRDDGDQEYYGCDGLN